MSLNRMPLFCFAILAVAFALLFALPPLTIDCVFLELQRMAGFHFFDVAGGGDPLLWQYLFWIFGHPEVYIIVLPAFGIATSIIPTFARRRMVAFPLVAMAELLVAFIGFGVFAHHMFATGLHDDHADLLRRGVDARRDPVDDPDLRVADDGDDRPARASTRRCSSSAGFIVFFVLGGLTGIMFAAIPFDQALTDTYFVVAHFHFVIFGAAVFPLLGGLYYWFPKVTGRMYREGWAKASFWLTFAGTMLTFFPMHIAGLLGMTRRVYTYEPGLGWDAYNLVETVGAFVLAAGLMLIAANLVVQRADGAAGRARPVRFGGTLEWTVPSPPPPYNFAVIPTVRSPYPNWDPGDRGAGRRRLAAASLVLDRGHETPASTVRDARLEEVLEMPSDSPWPIVARDVRRGRVHVAARRAPRGGGACSSGSRCSRSRPGTGRSRRRDEPRGVCCTSVTGV